MDGWHDRRHRRTMGLPHGVRTAYPLTVLNTGEVMRRAVSYVLPPLEPATAGRGRSSQ
jgi:hypothetical protein